MDQQFLPHPVGQVLECQHVGAGTAQAEPAYAWTYPTENAFIVARGSPDSTFDTLSSWWMRDVTPRSTLTVTAVSPSTGPAAGGTAVTITGTGLTHATRVSFGGAAATIVPTRTRGSPRPHRRAAARWTSP